MPYSPLYAPAKRRRPSPRRRPPSLAPWILSSLALTALAVVPKDWLPSLSLAPQSPHPQSAQVWRVRSTQTTPTCASVLNPDQRLSRGQLTEFLSIAQDAPRTTIHQVIASPYCSLSQSNQTHQQEAYPLAFDPDTWFVVNYHQGIYKDYDFVFRK